MKLKSEFHEELDVCLRNIFQRLGIRIGQNPKYFVILPLVISLLLTTGIYKIGNLNNPESIFTPINGEAINERRTIENLFPLNYSGGFDPGRILRYGRFARLIITAQDGGNLLRPEIWKEIIQVDQLIKSVKVFESGKEYEFARICARWGSECWGNDILEIADMMEEIQQGNITLNYPFTDNYAIPLVFGGIQLSNDSTVHSVEALQLAYFIDVDSQAKDQRGLKWESNVIKALDKTDDDRKWIRVDRFMQTTLPDQFDQNIINLIPIGFYSGCGMVIFAIVACMMGDWVKSKPWLGLGGIIASFLATTSAFGLLSYFGVPFTGMSIATPFLMLGIGIDDTFVMLAAWRQTSVHDSVSKRLGKTYSEAAVSITITSITDILSFLIGITSPFIGIQIFSIHTATAIVFTYIFQIFFVGALIAYFGQWEASNRHGLLWWLETKPRSKIQKENLNFFTKYFLIGGIDPNDPHNPLNDPDHSLMVFFKEKWAGFLNIRIVQLVVIILFFIYLTFSCWGLTQLEEGIDLKRLAIDGYAQKFYQVDTKYFKQFPYRIQIVITSELEYSNKSVQQNIEKMMTEMEESKYCQGGASFSESWLRSFLALVQNSKFGGFDFDVENEMNFIKNLEEYYLDESSVYSLDVKFNENKTKIIASRFIIETVNVTTSNDARDMVKSLRLIANSYGDLMNVTIFSPIFPLMDQLLIIRPTAIKLVCIAVVGMMVVLIIFIPNPICSLLVATSVLSIQVGVVGLMSMWNVNLDILSIMFLVMSIGFSVDFCAHISYSFVRSKDQSLEGRLSNCLYSMGLPIVQGAISTILGVIPLVTTNSYDYLTFFKVIFLVISIGIAHGLLLLPVLLILISSLFKSREMTKL